MSAMTHRTTTTLLALILTSSLAGCDSKPADAKAGDAKAGDAKAGDAKAGDAKAGDAKAGDAKAGDTKAGPDYAKIDGLVAAVKTSEDFDKILEGCMGIAIDMAMAKKIENAETDPDYWTHCKVGPARAQAQLVIKESTPDKMHTSCIAAAMVAEEIRDANKPESAEFKTLAENVNKACGM
jgi:hypothetical protein